MAGAKVSNRQVFMAFSKYSVQIIIGFVVWSLEKPLVDERNGGT